jgi:hypothetical protein
MTRPEQLSLSAEIEESETSWHEWFVRVADLPDIDLYGIDVGNPVTSTTHPDLKRTAA